MSQAGIVDFEGSHPQVPTAFVTNDGTAIPIANTLEILGEAVAADGIPVQTTGSGNTVTIQVQYASAAASSSATHAGLASFNSSQFTVDANGYVSFSGTAVPENFALQSGTTPVTPTGGTITFNGALVAAGSTPVQTFGSGPNTMVLEVQLSQAIASTNINNVGLAAFNSAQFTVDGNGFVSLVGSSAAIEKVNVQIGTTPIVPTSGAITVNGATVAAGTHPVRTDGTGANTFAVEVQISQALAATDATKIGLSNFNSTYFTVDANGFVSLVPTAVAGSFTVDAATAPGTNPVVPNGSGNITVTGGQVAAGTTANVIRTDSLAANTYTIQIQRSQAVASSTIGDNGVSHFNSAFFTVDSNGFVSLNGSAVGETITGNTGGALSPTSGNWNILGTSTAAGTIPVQTAGSGSTLTVQVQKAQAIASTDATKVGLANFNSAQFTVDANGFVSTSGTGIANTITGNSGGALSPTAGNWNIYGAATAAGSTPVTTVGSGSTLTVDVQTSQAIASTDATKIGLAAFNSADFSVDANGFVSATSTTPNYTNVNHAASPYTVLSTDQYISVDCSAGTVSLLFPNAPTYKRQWIIKDRTGNASTNNISVTTVGGTVTIDGQTTYTIDSNYAAIQLLANATPTYEVF